MEINNQNLLLNKSEKSVQDIVSKLKFIAKIQYGEKVDVEYLQVVANSWYTSMYRTFISRHNSRDVTLEFLRNTVDTAFDLAHIHLLSDQEYFNNIGKIIVSSISESIDGMNNLIKTYEIDRMFVAKINTLIEFINKKFEDINKQFGI